MAVVSSLKHQLSRSLLIIFVLIKLASVFCADCNEVITAAESYSVICSNLENINCEEAEKWTQLRIINSSIIGSNLYECPMNNMKTLIVESSSGGWDWNKIPTNLEQLHITKHRLTNIPNYLIPQLDLTDLSLYDNGIEVVAEKAFVKANIEKLDLSSNAISKIEPQTFAKNPTLELNLQHNRIATLKDVVFAPSIELLLLDYNNLMFLPDFNSYDSLIEITASHNKLNVLIDFNNLTALKLLDLSHNKLSSFDGKEIVNLHYLEFLDLSHNEIVQADLNFIQNVVRKSKENYFSLYLHQNHLQNLNISKILSPLDTRVSLFGNPINCKCNEEIYKFFEESQNFYLTRYDKKLLDLGKTPICYEFNSGKCVDFTPLSGNSLKKFKKTFENVTYYVREIYDTETEHLYRTVLYHQKIFSNSAILVA